MSKIVNINTVRKEPQPLDAIPLETGFKQRCIIVEANSKGFMTRINNAMRVPDMETAKQLLRFKPPKTSTECDTVPLFSEKNLKS